MGRATTMQRTVARAAQGARPEKVTYALALLDEPTELSLAVRELVGVGVASSRITVLASDGTSLATLKADNEDGELMPLPVDFPANTSGPAAGVPGWVHDLILASAELPRVPERSAAFRRDLALRLLEQQVRSVEAQPSSGAGLVVVRLEGPSEQIAVCATLLAYSRSGVQTHEIRQLR